MNFIKIRKREYPLFLLIIVWLFVYTKNNFLELDTPRNFFIKIISINDDNSVTISFKIKYKEGTGAVDEEYSMFGKISDKDPQYSLSDGSTYQIEGYLIESEEFDNYWLPMISIMENGNLDFYNLDFDNDIVSNIELADYIFEPQVNLTWENIK